MRPIAKHVAFCFFFGAITLVSYCTAELPRSAETIVSDARGFGALRLLNSHPTIHAKIGLDNISVEELKVLGAEASKRFSELSRKIKDGKLSSREEIVEQLDQELEGKLAQIIAPDVFEKFSRYVVADRLAPQAPMFVLLRPGTAKYLGLDQKSTEDIQRRVDEFLKTEGSASYRRDAFKQLIKTAPAEFRSRVVDLVGTKFLSEEIPSKNHPPILKAPFNYYMIVAACTKRYSQVIFGNNASVLEKLDILRSDLYARSSLRSRAEHEEALSQGRAVDTQRVLRENDEMAETEIRRILNHEQLVEFSQFGMSGTISSRSSDCKFHSTMPIPSAVFSNDLNA
jgi:hypothetical protein